MSSLTTEQRTELLNDLSRMGSHGRAEGEDLSRLPKTFYPVADHLRMLDPDVVLVVGPRGSGKTEIFRAFTDAGLAVHIGRFSPSVRILPPEKTDWTKGYPVGREGFDAYGLTDFIRKKGAEVDTIQGLWFTYLIRGLKQHLDSAAETALSSLFRIQAGAAEDNFDTWVGLRQESLLALDRLDEELERNDRYIVIAYDELDTLGGSDWNAMGAGVRGLIALWAAYARRWRRIRPKIFLRTDLFDRFATSGGADLAKLAAGRVELSWSERELYAMLLRRIANTSERLEEYIRACRSKIEWKNDPNLGWIPKLNKWTDVKPVIERLLGPYMGTNSRKGLTFRWPIAHVSDGRKRVVPRPMVRLFEEAASGQSASDRPVGGMRILHPTSMRRALDRVSSEHVEHALDEWSWIHWLKKQLNGRQVPADRREIEDLLIVSSEAEKERPPFADPRELLDYIIEVGILSERRSDGRVDVPDLFLYGLGLKRKGGVSRM